MHPLHPHCFRTWPCSDSIRKNLDGSYLAQTRRLESTRDLTNMTRPLQWNVVQWIQGSTVERPILLTQMFSTKYYVERVAILSFQPCQYHLFRLGFWTACLLYLASSRDMFTFHWGILAKMKIGLDWIRNTPEVAGVIFSDSDSAPVPKFLNPDPVREFFKFEKPSPVHTPATIDPTEIYPCFYLRNDHTDSCYCWNWKVTPDPVFHKILTPGPVWNEISDLFLFVRCFASQNKFFRLLFWCMLCKSNLFRQMLKTHKKLQYRNNYNHLTILDLVSDLSYFHFLTLTRHTYLNTKPDQ